ncbi:unnamed protein product [Bemisia tabaci]|uniref:Uncharacterized protein n=2 Tax=Eukaryota TaxID=2759 RepID=A0A9P0AEG1_BEMTA|nr:unnamed protein product [Bemisia tabaci]
MSKSGATKRRERAERDAADAKGRQNITKFFKKSELDETQTLAPCTSSAASGPIPDVKSAEPHSSAFDFTDGEVRECDSEISDLVQRFENENVGPNVSDLRDPQKWPKTIEDANRVEIVRCAPAFDDFITQSRLFPKDTNGQSFTEFFLYSKSNNEREKYPRDWLIWSASEKTLHCMPCILFEHKCRSSANRSDLAKRKGFCPEKTLWKKLYDRLPSHESTSEHRNCYTEWKSLKCSLSGKGLDSELRKQEKCEAEKWKAILRRILDVTLFLASRGLPFQGDSTLIGDVHNGNFLGTLELMGKYDEVIREHLAKIKAKQLDGGNMQGQAHYLSWKSQNEFISLCGDKVLEAILDERLKTIYYGIIADATPDISKIEQNVLILRYVFKNGCTEKFEVCERFLKFIDFNDKKGEDITLKILSALEELKIPLEDCRAQGYDGGSNMSGKIKGVQARILEKNELALFSPCGAHSLNRSGLNAAKLCPEVLKYFGNLECLYVVFSGSPSRWEILLEEIPLSLKRMPETRWSERKEAVVPLARHYPGVLKALDRLLLTDLPLKSYSMAVGLKNYFSSFEGLIMTVFWQKILAMIDEKNVIIQSQGISLDIEIKLIQDLINDIQRLRDAWDQILEEARLVAEQLGISTSFVEKRGRLSSESGEEPLAIFRRDVFFPVLDFILQDLRSRFGAVNEIVELFTPILKYLSLDDDELRLKSQNLAAKYPSDLSPNLRDEIVHLKHVSVSVFGSKSEISPLDLLNLIYEKKLESIFVNVTIAIRIFLTLPVTVASGERAFSRLSNTLKTWQRASTGQDRLNSLALLYIEHRLASTLDFSDVIQAFSSMKARKKIF